MNVILDTNIFQSNFSLKSIQMEALSVYLQKTDGNLILPYVIKNELILNYRKELKSSIEHLKTEAKRFHNCATIEEYSTLSKAIKELNGRNNEKLDQESKDYISYIKETIQRVKELDLPQLNIKRIVDKALKKEKPFKQNGEGFKDTVIWESILAYCRSDAVNSIIFISNNSQDFGKEKLLPVLDEQAKADTIMVYYYNSIDAFIQDKFENIKNIQLGIENIDVTDLVLLTGFKIKERKTEINEIFQKESTPNRRYADFQGIHTLSIQKIENPVIKDVADNFKYIHASLICKIGLVCIAEIFSEFTNPITGDYDYDTEIELDEIVADCVIEISLKYSEGVYEDLQIFSISFS